MKKKIIFIIGFVVFSVVSMAQSGSPQDCVGAISVCQSTYNEPNAYSGHGNIVDYTGHRQCGNNRLCIDPETNSVWYTFQVQTSGILDFKITPNGPNTDYDWALFNLTNRTCADLANVSLYNQIVASCNAAYGYGTTGANSLTPNTNTNCQGPSSLNGAPINNAPLNVTAGQVYYLNIQNWSGTTAGYLLDFSNSTANIFDNIKPFIDTILPVTCGSQQLRIRFSENVQCNSVNPTNFTLTGPAGNVPITSITGQGCLVGGNQEIQYAFNIGQALQDGTYTLSYQPGTTAVADLCGNIAEAHSITFVVTGFQLSMTSTPADCMPNGTATATPTGGQNPYTYLWSNSNTTQTINNLMPGNYQITVTDNSGCIKNSSVNVNGSGTGLEITTQKTDVDCAGASSGSIILSVNQGQAPYTYNWNDNVTLKDRHQLTGGNYSVTVSDANGCSNNASVQIEEPTPLVATIINIVPDFCSNRVGEIEVQASGGVPDYQYIWSNIGITNINHLLELPFGNYTVTVKDQNSCTVIIPFIIEGSPRPIADFHMSPARVSSSNPEINFFNLSQNATDYLWFFDDGNTSNEHSPIHTYQEVGHYNVMLVAYNGEDCSDTAVKKIEVYQDFFFYIPNAFTSDNDGLNETFKPIGTGFKPETFEMKIFNRWGQLIFETKDFEKGWDGRIKNIMYSTNDVFIYQIDVIDLSSKRHRFNGHVSKIGAKKDF